MSRTYQLIQNLRNYLLCEHLSLLKTSITCISHLFMERNTRSIISRWGIHMQMKAGQKDIFLIKRKDGGKKNAFFKGIPSLSGSMLWIANNTSDGVNTGPEEVDPCRTICSSGQMMSHNNGFPNVSYSEVFQMQRLPE